MSANPGLDLVEVPLPALGPTDVLIKVQKTGICGTDLHIQQWDAWARANIVAPLILGHEFCGEVVELGSAVTDLELGMFVSAEGHFTCGRCRSCLAGQRHLCISTHGIGVQSAGCFAEYIAMPAANVWVHRVPIDPDVAAIFDPFGNAVHTALQFNCLGEDVLVSGAGPIGIMAGLVAKHAGARHVVMTDLSDSRLALAKSLGVDHTINVGKVRIADAMPTLNIREGFDVGLEMSGAQPALAEMIDNMRHGGNIAMLGIPAAPLTLDFAKVVFRMLTIQGVYGREIFETWYEMSVLLQAGLDISGVITDRFHFTDFQHAFDVARDGLGGKVILDWTT